MFDPATFQRREDGFVSRSIDGYSLSPVYTLAVAARRVTEASSGAVTLHHEYGHATFDDLAWLLVSYASELKLREVDAIESLMRFVRKEP